MKWTVDQLNELKSLSKQEKKTVLQEFNHGWHFLLLWGKIIGVFLLAFTSMRLAAYFDTFSVLSKLGMGFVIYCLIVTFGQVFYVNVLAKRAIKDLIKEMDAKVQYENDF